MVPSTQSTSYRCSLPGLAGFASVPSPGTAAFFPQLRAMRQPDLVIKGGFCPATQASAINP
jgi:hypothetical protein